ncbi:MAG: sodium:calcium antiporter, partial [Oscillospiraceae bacterium]|nr:sodium:calcium antiporter [Oscillospiraceae bacterium]
MLKAVILFAIGLVLLIKGGDWFVDGATGIARRFKIPEIIVGATVVSIGTTLPEVMVSATGALAGQGSMAYGNAIGSIICNTSLIAAITLAIKPGPVDPKALKMPVIFFFVSAAIYCVAAYFMGEFTRPLGFLLLAIFVVYMVITV